MGWLPRSVRPLSMNSSKHQFTVFGSTALFVLLWSSGAIFAKWGLEHSSALAFLILRFAIALITLLFIGTCRQQVLPIPGSRLQVVITGVFLSGGYSICYFLALERGVTPGTLATLLGAQPILTLLFFERRFSIRRLLGLIVALAGLILIVHQTIELEQSPIAGTYFAIGALICMTIGAILQKGINQPPLQILPLQYATSLLLCVMITPFESIHIDARVAFLIPLLWLGLVISVIAQLLLYRMIRSGNLVNVTALFYLVPIVTVALDLIVFGHRPSIASLTGMIAIVVGLLLVFRKTA
jgi:drug/metabolite transporter (DMT)-like permease